MKDAFKKGFGFTVGSMLGYAVLETIARAVLDLDRHKKNEKPEGEAEPEADKNE